MLLILPIMIVETLLEQLFTDYEPYTGEEDQESNADEEDSREREIATGGDSREQNPAASENDSHKHEPAAVDYAQQDSEHQAQR